MHIDDPDATDEVEAFTARVHTRLAEHGALAGVEHGEAFKLLTAL
jgi:hypothetical protein